MTKETLKDYIDRKYANNKAMFGRDQEPPIAREQVWKMVNDNKYFVVDGNLYLFRRKIIGR